MTVTRTLTEIALDKLGLLDDGQHEQVLARLAESHPTLVLDAVRAVESVWHGKVET